MLMHLNQNCRENVNVNGLYQLVVFFYNSPSQTPEFEDYLLDQVPTTKSMEKAQYSSISHTENHTSKQNFKPLWQLKAVVALFLVGAFEFMKYVYCWGHELHPGFPIFLEGNCSMARVIIPGCGSVAAAFGWEVAGGSGTWKVGAETCIGLASFLINPIMVFDWPGLANGLG